MGVAKLLGVGLIGALLGATIAYLITATTPTVIPPSAWITRECHLTANINGTSISIYVKVGLDVITVHETWKLYQLYDVSAEGYGTKRGTALWISEYVELSNSSLWVKAFFKTKHENGTQIHTLGPLQVVQGKIDFRSHPPIQANAVRFNFTRTIITFQINIFTEPTEPRVWHYELYITTISITPVQASWAEWVGSIVASPPGLGAVAGFAIAVFVYGKRKKKAKSKSGGGKRGKRRKRSRKH